MTVWVGLLILLYVMIFSKLPYQFSQMEKNINNNKNNYIICKAKGNSACNLKAVFKYFHLFSLIGLFSNIQSSSVQVSLL